MTPKDQELAARLRHGSLQRSVYKEDTFTGPLAKPLNTLVYGTPHVQEESLLHKSPHAVALEPTMATNKSKYGTKEIIGATPNNPRAIRMGQDKLLEYKILNKYAPGATGKAEALKPYLRQLKGTPEQRMEQLQTLLSRKYGKGFILKGLDESGTAGGLITERDNLANILRAGKKYVPAEIRHLEQLGKTDYDKFTATLKRNPELRKYLTIRNFMRRPSSMLVQEKIHMPALGPTDRLLEKIIHGRNISTQEYRLHAIGDRVLPITTPRYGPLSQFLSAFGYRPAHYKQMEDFAHQTLRKLPQNLRGRQMFALDMANTKLGPKIIETNPGAYSGFLHKGIENPLNIAATTVNNQRFMSALRGQNTIPVSMAKAVGAGGLGLGAYLTMRKVRQMLADRHNNNTIR